MFPSTRQIASIRMKQSSCPIHCELWAHTWCNRRCGPGKYCEHQTFGLPRFLRVFRLLRQKKVRKKRRFWSFLVDCHRFSLLFGAYVGVCSICFRNTRHSQIGWTFSGDSAHFALYFTAFWSDFSKWQLLLNTCFASFLAPSGRQRSIRTPIPKRIEKTKTRMAFPVHSAHFLSMYGICE